MWRDLKQLLVLEIDAMLRKLLRRPQPEGRFSEYRTRRERDPNEHEEPEKAHSASGD